MSFLKKLRLPYREETAFGLLALCLFLVPLIFSLYSYENFESIKFSLFLILTGASAALFFLKTPAGDKKFVYQKGLYIFLAIFNILAVVSAVLAQDKVYAFFGFYYRYTSGIVFYLVISLFLLLLVNFLNAGKLSYLLKIFVADALVVAVVTYLQSFGWLFYAGEVSGLFRGPSLLGNSNYSAMFLAVILPLCLYYLKLANSKVSRIYYAVTAFIIIFAVFVLASRGALLAVAVSMVVTLFFLGFSGLERKLFWKLLLALIIVSVAGFYLLAISRPQAVTSIINSKDPNTTTRLYAWGVSQKQIYQHPWFGSGPGNYALVFEQSRNAKIASSIGVFDDAHNLFLQLAVTGGLPLVLIFIWAIFYSGFHAFHVFRKKKDLLYLALFSSLVVYVVAVCFNPVPIPMYLILVVLVAGIWMEDFVEISINFSVWKKVIFIFFGIIIFLWGLVNLTAEHLLGLARDEYQGENYSQSYTLSNISHTLNPTNGLALVYRAYSNAYLLKDNSSVESDIIKNERLHPLQANSYVESSDLYQFLYRKTSEKKYLLASIASMESALKIDPFFAERYGQLAIYYFQLGDYTASEINIKQAISMDKSIFPAWIMLAKLDQIKGNKSDLIFALTQAFNLKPDSPQLKYLLNLAKNTDDIKKVPIEIYSRSPGV